MTLSEFLQEVRSCMAAHFAGTHRVVAEIAAMQGNKHLYMELIEKEGSETRAKVRANLWAYNRHRVLGHFEHVTRERLKPGMKVLLEVEAEFHVQYGFSFTIVNIDPSYSLGEFERQKQQTIDRLREEGLLEANKYLPLPRIIHRVAVLTSATAAGYQDFEKQIAGNGFGYAFDLVLFPCLVQGEKAPLSMVEAMDIMERDREGFDVVVLIRGGGSVIDLSCFDDYEMNRTLAQSSYPVITGIGHDRDQSVADMVAHRALKTPTAVAEMLIEHNAIFEQELRQIGQEIAEEAGERVRLALDELHFRAMEMRSSALNATHEKHLRLQRLGDKLGHGAYNVLTNKENANQQVVGGLRHALAFRLQAEDDKLERIQLQVQSLEPARWLARGYTLSLVRGIAIVNQELAPGDEMTTISRNQRITSKITHIE